MPRGSVDEKTPLSRSSALLVAVTRCDQRRFFFAAIFLSLFATSREKTIGLTNRPFHLVVDNEPFRYCLRRDLRSNGRRSQRRQLIDPFRLPVEPRFSHREKI